MNLVVSRTILIALVAALAGMMFGALVLGGKPRVKVKTSPAPVPAIVAPAPIDQPVHLNMASSYPTSAPQFGTLGVNLTAKVARASAGSVDIAINEPGAILPVDQAFDALANGDLDALWSSPAMLVDKDSAFAFFGGAPFGPRAAEFLGWIYYGGGRDLQQELFAPYNVVAIPCAVTAPEAGGWFRDEIRGPADLKGLNMRFMGLGAKVIAKLGVNVLQIPGGDIYQQLQAGNIDATEFSQPAIDLRLGLFQVVKNYYFPGWHQQSTLVDLMIAQKKWDTLSDTQRSVIELACGDNIREGLAEAGSLQIAALNELKAKGVEIRRFPPAVMAALDKAWQNVAADESQSNPAFKKAYESYSAFRDSYAMWRKMGYVE